MSPEMVQEAYLAACHFAARAHGEQRYPGTDVSYLMHLAFVSMEVLVALGTEPWHDAVLAVQCALLHDVVEDTGTSADELEAAFGARVRAGVQALTKSDAVPPAEAMADSLRRIREQPREVWMVKLADRITNLQPPPPRWSEAKCAGYRDEGQRILEALGEASPLLAARLAHKLSTYAQWCGAPGP